MNQVRSQIHGEDTGGLTGKGIGVAVLDTGCYPHEDLYNRIAGFRDFAGRSAANPYDDNGHGTHVCGIIGGSGACSLRGNSRAGNCSARNCSAENYRGIAPGCHLIPVKVLDRRGNGFASDVLAGLRYIREEKEHFNIRIVNISVGSYSKLNMREDSALVRGVNAAWDDGLIVVVAAGNMGPERGTITTPGISRKVITVGCSDDEQEVRVMGRRMVNYSGRGPTSACVCKPDLVAPGASVISCSNRSGGYAVKSGTSMSTPIVSGAIALLLEKYPDMSNRDVKIFLKDRVRDLGLPRNQQGWGMLDIERLLK